MLVEPISKNSHRQAGDPSVLAALLAAVPAHVFQHAARAPRSRLASAAPRDRGSVRFLGWAVDKERCRLAAALAVVAVAACAPGSYHPFRLELDFGAQNGGPRACRQDCDAYEISCNAKLGVRISAVDDPRTEYDFRCVSTPPMDNLCGLEQIEFDFRPLPVGPARLEVAIWREDVLGDRHCLREPIFDLRGEPLVTISPQPAVAGAAYFDIGSAEQASIPMACTFPEQLTPAVCPDLPASNARLSTATRK
ncbi:MAG: hypothetical protein MJE77_14365 [Proteobacteria bacterium]|nr:hypothetical protein [Pseudomonadota bacterium]